MSKSKPVLIDKKDDGGYESKKLTLQSVDGKEVAPLPLPSGSSDPRDYVRSFVNFFTRDISHVERNYAKYCGMDHVSTDKDADGLHEVAYAVDKAASEPRKKEAMLDTELLKPPKSVDTEIEDVVKGLVRSFNVLYASLIAVGQGSARLVQPLPSDAAC